MQTKLLTLGTIDAATIKRIQVVRFVGRGGTRTISQRKDIVHFIANHADVELECYAGRLASVKSGSDFLSIVVNVSEVQ